MKLEEKILLHNSFEMLPLKARLDERMVAAVKGCSVSKLQRDRVFGGIDSIPYIKDGRKVYYIKETVLRHLSKPELISTSQHDYARA